jgi:hypothetical protein
VPELFTVVCCYKKYELQLLSVTLLLGDDRTRGKGAVVPIVSLSLTRFYHPLYEGITYKQFSCAWL